MQSGSGHSILTHSPDQTHALGQLIGRRLQSGLLIKLIGDLGSGKTCFVQGLASGLDVPEDYDITSPTYTLIHEYPGRIRFHHIDLYRIHDEMDAEAIGLWDMLDPDAVVAVEWADRLPDESWPAEALTLQINARGNDDREITLIGSGLKMINLIKEIGAAWSSGSR